MTTGQDIRLEREMHKNTWSNPRGRNLNSFCRHCKNAHHSHYKLLITKKNEKNECRLFQISATDDWDRPHDCCNTCERNSLTWDFINQKSHVNVADAQNWLLDLGASFHVTPHREWFATYSWSAGLEQWEMCRRATFPGSECIYLYDYKIVAQSPCNGYGTTRADM